MKDKTQIIVAAVSLFALLTYTLVHTGGLLARYIHPPVIGYVAALGIELSIVSLSLRIGDMRRARQSDRFLSPCWWLSSRCPPSLTLLRASRPCTANR